MAEAKIRKGTIAGVRVSGIVLAGSYQWTGSSFEQLRVRPLLPVALKPIIGHVLDWFEAAGILETTICANGSTSAIRRHLDETYSSALHVSYHEDGTPRGAAGCVKDAAAQSDADVFIVTDGATIPTADLASVVEKHVTSKAALTIVVHRSSAAFSDVPQFHPTGTYVFDRQVLDSIPATSFHDIKENLIPKMYRDGLHIELFEVDNVSPRVFTADAYLALNRWMMARVAADQLQPGTAHPEPLVHPTAWVDESAILVGPVVLGAGVRVHASATIVGPCVIGAGTVVHAGASVARSITWDGCTIGENAFVDQCVLADHASVAPREAISGVLRLDSAQAQRRFRKPVPVHKPALTPREALAKPALT
jgi:NDP-sugar pyrophosphorylase family protein